MVAAVPLGYIEAFVKNRHRLPVSTFAQRWRDPSDAKIESSNPGDQSDGHGCSSVQAQQGDTPQLPPNQLHLMPLQENRLNKRPRVLQQR